MSLSRTVSSPEAGSMDRGVQVEHDEVEMVPLPPKLLTPTLTPEQNFRCRAIMRRACSLT